MKPPKQGPCSSQTESELMRGHGITEQQLKGIYEPKKRMPKRDASRRAFERQFPDHGEFTQAWKAWQAGARWQRRHRRRV